MAGVNGGKDGEKPVSLAQRRAQRLHGNNLDGFTGEVLETPDYIVYFTDYSKDADTIVANVCSLCQHCLDATEDFRGGKHERALGTHFFCTKKPITETIEAVLAMICEDMAQQLGVSEVVLKKDFFKKHQVTITINSSSLTGEKTLTYIVIELEEQDIVSMDTISMDAPFMKYQYCADVRAELDKAETKECPDFLAVENI